MTWWRSVAFLAVGMSRFTRQAYESAAAAAGWAELPARADATVLVTGANSGIGFAAAEALVRRGASVHMVCRSPERGEEARALLEEAAREGGAGGSVRLHLLDLGCVPRARAFGEAFAASGAALHAVVNNAGCMVDDAREEGGAAAGELNPNTAVNVVGTAALTEALLPALRRAREQGGAGAPPPVVITVSSGGMLSSGLPDGLEAPAGADKVAVYARDKRTQVALSERWAELHGDVATFCSMHPGWADTPALREAMPDFHRRFRERLRTPAQGADTVVWAVLCRDQAAAVEPGTAPFLLDRQPQAKHLPLAWTKYKPEEAAALHEAVRAAVEARPPADEDRAAYAYLAE